jgi:hypothetical protein
VIPTLFELLDLAKERALRRLEPRVEGDSPLRSPETSGATP